MGNNIGKMLGWDTVHPTPMPLGTSYIPPPKQGNNDTADKYVGSKEAENACRVAVTTAAANAPTPAGKAATTIVGNAACGDLGPDSKIGSEAPPNPLLGPAGTT